MDALNLVTNFTSFSSGNLHTGIKSWGFYCSEY